MSRARPVDPRLGAALGKLWKALERGGVSRAAADSRLRSAEASQPKNPRKVSRATAEEMGRATALPKGIGAVPKTDGAGHCGGCSYAAISSEEFQTALQHGVRVNSQSKGRVIA